MNYLSIFKWWYYCQFLEILQDGTVCYEEGTVITLEQQNEMKDERFKNYNATVRFIKNIVPLFDLLNSKGNMQVGFKSTFWKIFKNKCYRNTPVLLDIDNIKSYTWQKDLQHRLQHSSCSMRTIVKKSKTIIYPFHYVSSL